MNKDVPLVAIWMVTYNHEAYIAEALDSIISQKANFTFRLFIGEDCSTDNTREICERYAQEYTEIICLLDNEQNLGPIHNAIRVYKVCFQSGAKYVAMCEGDDYWADPSKLQKQVDILEEYHQFSFCFHDVNQIDDHNNTITKNISRANIYNKKIIKSEQILCGPMVINTLSLMFRNRLFEIPPWFSDFPFGDKILEKMLALHGDAYFFKEVMGVYRNHSGGVTKSKKWLEDNRFSHLEYSISLYQKLLSIKGEFDAEIIRINIYYYQFMKQAMLMSNRLHRLLFFLKYLRLIHRRVTIISQAKFQIYFMFLKRCTYQILLLN